MPGSRTASLLAAMVLVAAAAFTVPAFGKGDSPKPAERIVVKDNFFSARSVTVAADDSVRWVWRGNNRHNVAFKRVPKGAGRRGATARRKGRWQRTFHEPGTYRYVCTLFTGMRGTITVEPPPVEPSGPAY